MLGSFDAGVLVTQYLGVLLEAAAAVAIGEWISSLAKNQVSAFVGSVLALLALVLVDRVSGFLGARALVASLLNWLSLAFHYDSFSRGVVDTRRSRLLPIGLGPLPLPRGMGTDAPEVELTAMEQNIRKRRSLVVLLLGLAVIVAAVLVTERFSFRLDLSADGANTLSKASRELYKEIPEQVRITYYISSTLSDRHPGPRAVEGLVRSLAAASRGKIAVDVADPASGKKEAAVEALGVAPQRMQIVEKNEQRVALVYSGIVVQYLGPHPGPALRPLDRHPRVRPRQGHQGRHSRQEARRLHPRRRLGQEPRERLQDPLRRPQAVRLGLQGGPPGDAVPPETSVLLVLGNSALDDYDAYRIDAYLASGGRALFAVKGVDVQVRQGLAASPLKNDALLRALESYGVKVDRELVLDQSSLTAPFQVASPYGGQAIS